VLFPVAVDADRGVGGLAGHDVVVSDLDHDGVQEHHRVDGSSGRSCQARTSSSTASVVRETCSCESLKPGSCWRRKATQHSLQLQQAHFERGSRTLHGSLANDKNPPAGPARRKGLGRSRGGLSTKIHLAADGAAGPSPASPPPASTAARRRPTNRTYLRRRKIKAVIPVKDDQKNHRRNRGSHGGRPPAFDREQYNDRNTVERCFSKLKQFRAVATRYDKREFMYRGTIDLASIRLRLRDPVP
jgi:transposase